MKKIVYCLVILSVIILVGCNGKTDGRSSTGKGTDVGNAIFPATDVAAPNITLPATDVGEADLPIKTPEEIGDEEFVSYVESQGSEIYRSLYEIEGRDYGRIIASSTSKEDAVRVVTRHFTDNRYPQAINKVVECEVIYESILFYGVYVKWEVNGHYYDENVISFKKSVADITVKNVVYGDEDSYKITTKNDEEIKQIALYLFFDKFPPHKLLDFEVQADDKKCLITLYNCTVHYDWDFMYGESEGVVEYKLSKQSVEINKENGNVVFGEAIPLKTFCKPRAIETA